MKHDGVYLRHILDEIVYLVNESSTISPEEFLKNETLKRAFSRSLEIIGEAAKHLSSSLREKHAKVEWGQITGLRDKLIHHYFGVDWDLLWDIVRNKLPEFRQQIESILNELTE
ncbi:hypothetical protein A3H38_03040 [candidate division WOR-1 bacterium RIFCSPLOWO2_02_FULL_46_20]|uniref:DUF86 domain-containing protein n=2 Tax=Saganbacteria TaxID=1703751 RepID=A0A1F4R8W3_UNCSA|nr:MAG: hypothetical protein A3J44_00795 [candidate division WOR-1 bacterium RIFCSPHIGHO2_02_FULL_45_12]OGC04617.1 MAG: hypothetical protein A3H38_03040 [candidate division WOR-1 bacterium RIFCSPLOWO2_02_FULL_46_20]OGC08866.1 MAG: hypothetical protein A3F86_00280 [candidate division WOR-1 bacterium RIFCSPLOWO2_12_FULL_45_9]